MNNLPFLGLNQQEKIKDELRVPSKVICHLIGPVSFHLQVLLSDSIS